MKEFKDIKLELNTEAGSVIQDLATTVSNTLNEEAVGFYLMGSIATGGFIPGVSDIDFMVVTKNILSHDLVNKLANMHKQFNAKLPHGFSEIEGSYIPMALINKFNGENEIYPHLGTDGHFAVEKHDSDWIMQRYILRNYGVVVYGPDLKNLIDPVTSNDLIASTKGVLKEWWKPQLTDTHLLTTAEYQSYAVLTMCRGLYTLKNGDVTSKGNAANWAKDNGLQKFSILIDKAMDYRNGKQFGDLEGTLDIIRVVVSLSEEI